MFSFAIKGNPRWLGNIAKEIKSDFPRAAAQALNRTATGVRSVAVKSIAGDLGIKQKAVRDATRIRRANISNLEAAVIATGKRIPLFEFAARQTRKGVTYRLGPRRKTRPGSFIARMRSGHVGVFKRRFASRLPIRELFGPSIPRVFTRRHILRAMRELAHDRLQKELDHQLAFYARKAG